MPRERTRMPGRPEVAGVAVHALVPAAGHSERFGGETPKQFLEVGGRPLLAWTVRRLFEAGCASVSVALPADQIEWAMALDIDRDVFWTVGGESRQQSVAAALEVSPARADEWILVHDAARAAVDPGDVAATVAAASEGAGAVLGRSMTDTVKEVVDGKIVRTVRRESLFRAETPQVFRRELIERALSAATADGFIGTDEASLVERLGGPAIVAVEARRPNPKVTFPEDLALVGRLLLVEEWR